MSRNFRPDEFACKCCGQILVEQELMAVLELVRREFSAPVIITSGYRCPSHNKAVGGADGSKHMEGIAADIKIPSVSPGEIFDFLDYTFPDTYGIGLYSGWVHIDIRTSKARW